MKSGKIWGETEMLESNRAFEFHRVSSVKGGRCSEHYHQSKWNGFYVVSGMLRIKVWKTKYELVDVTILKPGDWTKIPPGEYHSFEALVDTEFFEMYWTELDADDIVRRSVGTKDPQ